MPARGTVSRHSRAPRLFSPFRFLRFPPRFLFFFRRLLARDMNSRSRYFLSTTARFTKRAKSARNVSRGAFRGRAKVRNPSSSSSRARVRESGETERARCGALETFCWRITCREEANVRDLDSPSERRRYTISANSEMPRGRRHAAARERSFREAATAGS